METENEKLIEQIALENYAKEKLDKKYESIGIITGIVVGILSAISFVFIILNCETCPHDYGMMVLGAIVIAAMLGMLAMMFVILFSLSSRRNENIIKKSISLLSQDEKKKTILDYIQESIKSCQENIPYCEKEIQKLQSEIEELKKEIEEDNKRIPELQEKLNNLSSRGA
ncbi:hypothetical protein K9M48_05495 [Candidatus Gracilibacteria bacterium]|nr:hypothetical protein [Candidatus Gracilibacteria bacterium]